MKISKEKMDLTNIAEGAIVERFGLALEEILTNIQDPNTEADKERVINIKVIIKPDERREIGFVGIEVTPKPAPYKPIITKAVFGKDIKGQYEVKELMVPEQLGLPFKNVTNIDEKERKDA